MHRIIGSVPAAWRRSDKFHRIVIPSPVCEQGATECCYKALQNSCQPLFMCGKKPTAICRDDHVAFFCPFRVQWRQIPETQGDFTPVNRLVHRKRGQGRRQGRIRRRVGRTVPAGIVRAGHGMRRRGHCFSDGSVRRVFFRWHVFAGRFLRTVHRACRRCGVVRGETLDMEC